MITKPAKVPERKIDSVDLNTFDGGLYLGGAPIAPINSAIDLKDVELDTDGHYIPRRNLTKFLPDTVGISFQKYPVSLDDVFYFFTADDNKIKFCVETDISWTDCGGSNTFTTNNGGMTKFLRVLDKILILNGKNGDKLAYIDLETTGFPITKYDLVTDPTTALTDALTGLSSGSFNVYYAYSYSGAIGETVLSDIATIAINHTRDEWSTLATPGSIKLTRPGSPPAGSQFWNVYVAISSTAGTIQDSDMLLLAAQLDLATVDFVDNGTLSINLGQPAPLENSTDGPRVEQGQIFDGNPILYADQDNPYAIWIGGGGPNALDFSTSNGGYKAEPEKGTNFYPNMIIGFRTGQGVPALTVLYSNTEGLSKQGVLQQQTINYGDQSFTVWGITEQHYGAAGVAAPNSAINYNGRLLFLSTDGFMSMETQPSVQNVLSTKPISSPIDPYVRSIKNEAMNAVVGVGWNNKYMWLVPNNGFDDPQQILVLDANNKGIKGDGAWLPLSIAANWIGVVSPANTAAFVYVCKGNQTYKLTSLSSTFDLLNGAAKPFSTLATGPLIPVSGAAHNTWQAMVQVVFYIMNLLGDIEVGVTYRNQNGKLKTKSKVFHGPVATPSFAGGWGDPQWVYANLPGIPGYLSFPIIDESSVGLNFEDVRIKVGIDDITNEWQWFYRTEVGYNNYKLKAISAEGINLGIKPDLQ